MRLLFARLAPVLSLLLVLGLATVATAGHAYKGWQKGPWEHYKSKKGMTMWINEEVPTGVHGVRVDAIVDMPADQIFPILIDPKRQADYSFIREFKPLVHYGTWGYLYQRVRSTGIQDRDFTVKLTMVKPSVKNAGPYGWVWVQANDKGPPPRDGVVRADVAAGSYILTPVGKDATRTRISYRLWFDPSSWVPDFLINAAVRNAAFETVDTLRDDIERLRETGSWKK